MIKPAISQEIQPAGPAIEATLLTANSHADPKMAPKPIKNRSSKDISLLNFPFI
ncbi:hypothetical protein BN2127_JRS7_03941 [Bacillus subtilis]|nr:hypothetical protein BN2127_JRS7_03941 [Bacillus subtilis]